MSKMVNNTQRQWQVSAKYEENNQNSALIWLKLSEVMELIKKHPIYFYFLMVRKKMFNDFLFSNELYFDKNR